MSEYIKPVVLGNDDLAEGVYASSGAEAASSGSGSSSDCWDVSGPGVQDWDGSHHVFEIRANHHDGVVHITTQVTYFITFSADVTNVYAESGFECTFSGNTATVVRDCHANGYGSGDAVTFKVWASTGDEATTKALSISGISYVCRHETNVQGGLD